MCFNCFIDLLRKCEENFIVFQEVQALISIMCFFALISTTVCLIVQRVQGFGLLGETKSVGPETLFQHLTPSSMPRYFHGDTREYEKLSL